MRYTGDLDATLDLRRATHSGENAGGYISRVDGIAGGYTITYWQSIIENAEGGDGDDDIFGNEFSNIPWSATAATT